VLVFLGGKQGVRDVPDLVLEGPTGPLAGTAWVEGIGDVNGDGATDLLVVDHDDARGATFGYIYLGGPNGPGARPDLALTTPHRDLDHTKFVPVGDINGDGFTDVVGEVSCPPTDWPESHPDPRTCTPGLAELYVYLGSPSG